MAIEIYGCDMQELTPKETADAAIVTDLFNFLVSHVAKLDARYYRGAIGNGVDKVRQMLLPT